MLEHALAWAELGWRVLPVRAGTKIPTITGWQTRASRDPEQIRDWWSQWPDANIGGLCGDDWLVVDVDVKDGKQGSESVAALQADHGEFPPTRQHVTPTGGWHLIFRVPSNWSATKTADLPGYPGVDIQVGKAMIVLPPSQINGGYYRVVNEEAVAPGPAWLQSARIGTTGRGQHEPRMASTSVDTVMAQRDNQLYRFASKLRKEGHSEKGVAETLRQMAGNPLLYPMHGPKPEQDITRIVRSAFRHTADVFSDMSASFSTDRDNAVLISKLGGGEILWDDDLSCWFEWTGNRWRKSGYRLRQLTAEAVEALWSAWHVAPESSKDRRDILMRIQDFSTWGRLKGAWEFLKGECWMENAGWDNSATLLNTQNGTLDLVTGELRDHRPTDRITHITSSAYDPDADMTEWLEFVDWCFKGDEDLCRWAQVVFGQALVGRIDRALIVFLYGKGANGKSALMDAIGRTLGDYSYEAPVELVASKGRESLHDEYMVALRGKRLIICPEPSRGTHWADGRVKALSGGDTIAARPLYGSPISFKVQGLLVVHGNNQPEVRDRSEGMSRRMRLVPFDNRRADADQDPTLSSRMAGPAVMRWLVEGARYWLRHGDLPGSTRVAHSTADYLTEGNQIGRFTADCLQFDETFWVASSDVYGAYRSWTLDNGEVYKESASELFAQLRRHWKLKPHTREPGGVPKRGWQGMCLQPHVIAQTEDNVITPTHPT